MSEGGESNVWKYVGIGCLVTALLGACGLGACLTCAGAGVGGIMVAVQAPAEAAHGFLRDARSGNAAGAYARMSSGYRATHTETDFAERLSALPALTNAHDATLQNRNVSGATATMSGTLDETLCATGHSGCSVPVSVELSQEGEVWVIDEVLVEGTPLTASIPLPPG